MGVHNGGEELCLLADLIDREKLPLALALLRDCCERRKRVSRSVPEVHLDDLADMLMRMLETGDSTERILRQAQDEDIREQYLRESPGVRKVRREIMRTEYAEEDLKRALQVLE